MRQSAAKFKQIYAFAAGKFDSQARLIARQILLAGAKFDGISVNRKRNFKKSYKGHIEDTKGHYNSPKIKEKKMKDSAVTHVTMAIGAVLWGCLTAAVVLF